MKGYRHGESRIAGLLLHDEVAALAASLPEAVLLQDPACLTPESTRSLPNRNLDLGHEHFPMQTAFDFR